MSTMLITASGYTVVGVQLPHVQGVPAAHNKDSRSILASVPAEHHHPLGTLPSPVPLSGTWCTCCAEAYAATCQLAAGSFALAWHPSVDVPASSASLLSGDLQGNLVLLDVHLSKQQVGHKGGVWVSWDGGQPEAAGVASCAQSCVQSMQWWWPLEPFSKHLNAGWAAAGSLLLGWLIVGLVKAT
jgi:hypothetical protein